MRRFSEEMLEDREFEVGGELFKWRYPYWEDFAKQAQADAEILDTPKGDDNQPKVVDLYQEFITRIEVFLDPENDALKRWRALAKRKVDPVPAYMFPEIYRWLVGVTSNRPTELPSHLQNGRGQTEATSTDASSSQDTTPQT